jgi:hypothetical protein
MITNTITGAITAGVTLTLDTYNNPITIASAAYIGGDTAIQAQGSWAIVNNGTVNGTTDTGVQLNAGGTVTNEAGGTITGAGYGVYIGGSAGMVDNFGSIGATGAYVGGSGTLNTGVVLAAGGNVTNESGGTISGTFEGVFLYQPGTIINDGLITGTSTNSVGVQFAASGTVTNETAGTISGTNIGIYAAQAGTIFNDGLIAGTGTEGIGVELAADGIVTNTTHGTIAGTADGILWSPPAPGATGYTLTVDNAGLIAGTDASLYGAAIYLGKGLTQFTLSNSGTIRGQQGISDISGVATIDNTGTIAATRSFGVFLNVGGTVTNEGLITGQNGNTDVAGGYGIFLNSGNDSVTNGTTGTIEGLDGVVVAGSSAVVINAGTIVAHSLDASAGRYGVILSAITNTLVNTGTIIGDPGFAGVTVEAFHDATVENAGTISGGFAVRMFAQVNRLIVDAGAVFDGTVYAAPTAANTIELTSGASSGTLSGVGTEYLHFQTVTIDSGATWTVAGTKAGFNGTTIEGFNAHDRLDLTGFGFAAGETAALGGSDLLTITDGDGNVMDTIQLSGDFTGDFFHLAGDGNGGTFVTEDTSPPCYCRGTRIRTPAGEVAVETLRIGDRIMTADGDALPLKWIGRRNYRDWLAVGNADVQPILFKAGSIADHVPARDLYVSPEHAMFLDGKLIPAQHLVNGVSVLKVEGMEEIDYFHLEFDRHVVIFAEGAAAESFVDDDGRTLFHNADEYRLLYPDEPLRRDAEFCAPRIETGAALDVIHRTLATRAAHLRRGGAAAPWGRRGNVELTTRALVTGWAFSGVDAGPVALAILVNGSIIGRIAADRHRTDLEKAGIGNGCHGFRFRLPKGLSADIGHTIEVRREIDWTLLRDGCVTLEPAPV